MAETYPKIVPLTVDLRPSASGTQQIGTVAKPFSGVHAGSAYFDDLFVSGTQFDPNIINPSHVVTVSTEPKFGQFSGIVAAMTSITGATAATPYMVYVEPGVYVEDTITMKPYVSLVGSERSDVIIEALNPSGNLIEGVNNSAIVYLTLRGATASGSSAVYFQSTGTSAEIFYTEHLKFGNNSNLMTCYGDTGGSCFIMANNLLYGSSTGLFDTAFYATGGGGIGRIIIRNSSSITIQSGNFALVDAPGCQIVCNALQINRGSVGGTCFEVFNGGTLRATAINLRNWSTGVSVPNVGASPAVYATALNFENCTEDVVAPHVSAVGNISAVTEYGKVQIAETASLFIYGKDPEIITVAQKGGDYNSISDAVLAAGVYADAGHPYIIDVGPGVYTEPHIVVPSYVSIVGRNQTSVLVEPTGNNSIFTLDTNASMSFLSIQNVPAGYYGAEIINPGDYITLHKVSFVDCDTAMRIVADDSNPDNQVYLEYVDSTQDGTTSKAFEFVSISGTPLTISAENFYVYGVEGLGNPQFGIIASGSAGHVEVPWNATALSWDLLANLSGTLSVDVRKTTYTDWSGSSVSYGSIVGSEKPTITTAFKGQDSSLTTWSGISAGDILNFHVDATPLLITRATLAIKLRKTS